jgi:RNA polymerase sigma-70 factor, ECF subfamily
VETQDHPEDRELIERLLRGDRDAIDLVGRWIDTVLRAQFPSLQGEWDDLRQEALGRIFQNLRRGLFEGRSSLHTYAHRVVKNVAIDASRRAYRRRETTGEGVTFGRFSPPTEEQAAVDGDLVRRLLERLPEGDRLLLRLVYGDHQSYAEVARVLETTEAAVKSRMARCKHRMLSLHRQLAE